MHRDNNDMADILGSVSANPSNHNGNVDDSNAADDAANNFLEGIHVNAAIDAADTANDLSGRARAFDVADTANDSETSYHFGIMTFADGEDILYTPDIGNPLPGKVLGFDGTRYDIKLDKGTEMTVDASCLIRFGDTSSFGNSDESESSNKEIKMKPWQNIANSDSDSETETEVEDAPKFCKGEWVWYKQDDALPIRGRVTRDCRDREDVHITLHKSGSKRVCRQKFVSAAKPPPDFVDPVATTQLTSKMSQKKMKESSSKKKTEEDTKASDIASKEETSTSSTGGVRKSSRKKNPIVKPPQVTYKGGKSTASNNRSYEHKGERFSYKQMEACFCTPSNSTIKEPKYYKTIKYVSKPGVDLSKATTHDVRFCYCVKCDEIVEYRAGYYKGIQRHYLEKHATKKEKDTMAANTSKGKPTNVKTEDSRATAKGLTTRGRKKKMGPAASDEALADADERKVLADERKMREDLEKRMKDLEKEHEKLKKDLETEKAKHAKEEKTKAKKEKTKADEEADDSKNRADDPKKRSSKHRSSSSTSDSSSASSSKSSRRRGRKHKRKRRSRSHSRRSRSKSGDRRRSHRRHSRSKSGDRRRSRSKSPERSRSHRRHSRSRDRRRSRSKSPKRSRSHRRHSRSKSREHHSPTQGQQAHSQGGYDRYYRDNRHYGPSYDSRGPYGGGGPRAYNGGGNYYGGLHY